MMKIYFTSIIAIMMCISLQGCVSGGTSDDPDGATDTYSKVNVGDSLPPFSVTRSDGTICTNETLKGSISVVFFFNTTCPDCQAELPIIQSAYLALQAKASIQWLGISRADAAASISTYWKTKGFTLPYSPQSDRTIYDLFATQGIPRIYICNAKGVVTFKYDDNTMPTLETLMNAVLMSVIY
jgi:peroxiredoxin